MERPIPKLVRNARGDEGSRTVAMVVFDDGSGAAIRCDRNPGQRMRYIREHGRMSGYGDRTIINYIELFKVQSNLFSDVGERQDVRPVFARNLAELDRQRAHIEMTLCRLTCLAAALASKHEITTDARAETASLVLRRTLRALPREVSDDWKAAAYSDGLEHPKLMGLPEIVERIRLTVAFLGEPFTHGAMQSIDNIDDFRLMAGFDRPPELMNISINERLLGRVTLSAI